MKTILLLLLLALALPALADNGEIIRQHIRASIARSATSAEVINLRAELARASDARARAISERLCAIYNYAVSTGSAEGYAAIRRQSAQRMAQIEFDHRQQLLIDQFARALRP